MEENIEEYDSINVLCDRLRALIANPQYMEDMLKMKVNYSRIKEKEFLEKYNIDLPVDYEMVKHCIPEILVRFGIFTDVPAISKSDVHDDKKGWPSESVEVLKNLDIEIRKKVGYIGYCFSLTSEKISDDKFFEIIKQAPIFLQSSCALDKIEKWQEDLKSKNNDTVFQAQEKLKKIGTALALKKIPSECIKPRVSLYRIHALKFIKDKKIMKMRSKENQRKTLEEKFGDKIIDSIKKMPDTSAKLANIITAKCFQLCPSTVERYIKDCRTTFTGSVEK